MMQIGKAAAAPTIRYRALNVRAKFVIVDFMRSSRHAPAGIRPRRR
jgi:hypothetical protein